MSDNPIQRQVGGDHYVKMTIQPWDIIDALNLDFYEGTAVTYILRWRSKGGIQDLEKAIHTIERKIANERGIANETGSNQEIRRDMVEANQAAIRV